MSSENEAQPLPVALAATSGGVARLAEPEVAKDGERADQPVRQYRPAGDAAAAVDDSGRVAPVQEGSDRMDSGSETPGRPVEGAALNKQGAAAAAAGRGAEPASLSLERPVSMIHCALARCWPLSSVLCFSLFLSRGLCVDHGGWTSCGLPVRVPSWNARV